MDDNQRIVLGAISLNLSYIGSLGITARDFDEGKPQEIFRLCLEAYNQGQAEINPVKLEKLGTSAYELLKGIPSLFLRPANISEYLNRIRLLKEKTSILQTIDKALREPEATIESPSIEDLLNKLSHYFYLSKARPTETLSDHLKAKYEKERNRESGQLLGYKLDKFQAIARDTDGIQPGFYIIGAYTARGKQLWPLIFSLIFYKAILKPMGFTFP